MTWKLVGAAAMALAVAACGTQPEERTTGGAAAGAATGAGIGALGGPVGALAGAAIGAGAGAVTGSATSPSDVNLGEPPWSNPQARVPGVKEASATRRHSSRAGQYGSGTVRDAQQALQQRGFNPGSIDGRWGPQTASAVENFQRSNNMQPTGRLDSQVLQALNVHQGGAASTGASTDRNRAYMGGGTVGSPPRTGPNTTTGTGMSNPGTISGGGNTESSTTDTTRGAATGSPGSSNQPGMGGTGQTR